MNREELLALAQQKDDIEKELNDLANELKLQDNVGMTGELVDKEGFPRCIFFLIEAKCNYYDLCLFLETISILFECGRFVNE